MSPRPAPQLFEQHLPERGYRLRDEPDPVDLARLSPAGLAFYEPKHTFAQADSNDDVASYVPTLTFPRLHRDFAASGSSTNDLLSFVNSYGLLAPNIRTLEETLQHQGLLRSFASQIDESRKRNRGYEWPPKPRGKAPLIDAFNATASAGCRVFIDGEKLVRPTLVIVPTSLLAWMWMQFASEITEGLEYKECVQCGQAIEVRTVKQKRDLHYCSGKCRSAALRQRRREENQ